MTKTLVLLNPHAGTADRAEAAELWAAERGHELIRTEGPDDARRRARDAAAAGRSIVSAGGDGTFHVIADGALSADGPPPRLGLIPLGTGNDLARSLGLPDALEDALEVIDADHALAQDVLIVEHEGRRHSCVNVASAGFSGQLAAEMTPELKSYLGPLAYLWGGLSLGGELRPFTIDIELDEQRFRQENILNVVIANGRYAAGGFDLAPEALLDDGLFELVIVPFSEEWAARAELGVRLLASDYTQSPGVQTFRGRRLRLGSEPAMALNLDGEPIGEGPMQVTVAPGAIEVLQPHQVQGLQAG